MMWRTLLLCLTSALPASIFALVQVLWVRLPSSFSHTAKLLVCLTPVLIPVPLIATAVNDWGLEAYSLPLLYACHIIAGIPLAFICLLLLTAPLDPWAIATAATIGIPPGRTLRRAYGKLLTKAVATTIVVTACALAADPALTSIFGGKRSYIGSASIHASQADLPHDLGARIVVVILWIALLSAILLRRMGSSLPRLAPPPNPRTFSGISRTVAALNAPVLIVFLALIATSIAKLRSPNVAATTSDIVTETVQTTLVLALPSLVIGFILSAVAARWAYNHHSSLSLAVLAAYVLLLVSHTCGGMILARIGMEPAPLSLIPPLVGGASVLQGAIGIVLAYTMISFPVFFLVTIRILRENSALIEAARDNGSHAVRTFVTVVVPRSRTAWIAASSFIGALIMARTAPAIYVDSPRYPQAAAVLTTTAQNGDVTTTYILGLSIFAASALLLMCAGLLTLTIGRLHDSRRR
ncbi:hypothetical protein I6E29_03060 [Arcanobacterium haemolyticum]|nr:hypothetical protein [Arcanobacterium haemolyticum]